MVIKSSGKLGADALVFTGPCHLIGISFTCDTLKFTTLTAYDYLSAGGTAVAVLRPVSSITDVTNGTINLMFPGNGVHCAIGIHAELSLDEGDYIIYYSED